MTRAIQTNVIQIFLAFEFETMTIISLHFYQYVFNLFFLVPKYQLLKLLGQHNLHTYQK